MEMRKNTLQDIVAGFPMGTRCVMSDPAACIWDLYTYDEEDEIVISVKNEFNYKSLLTKTEQIRDRYTTLYKKPCTVKVEHRPDLFGLDEREAEIERLKAERKLLDEKIKNLQYKNVDVGFVSLSYDQFNHNGWRVLVKKTPSTVDWKPNARKTVNVSIISGHDRNAVIAQIPELLEDLAELYGRVAEGKS